jgi:hypothetical protein
MVIPMCLMMPVRFFELQRRGGPFPWSRTSQPPNALAFTFSDLFIYWIIYAVAEAATTNAVADLYLGRHSTIREAYGKIRGRFWSAIIVTLSVYIRTLSLMFVFAVLGAVAGIALTAAMNSGNIPSNPAAVTIAIILAVAGFALGLLISVRYTLSLSAIPLEKINGRAAIRRSVQLSLGRRGQIFIGVLLGVVISYSAAILFEGPFYLGVAVMGIRGHLPTWLNISLSISGALGSALASPLLMIVPVLFYYDLRIRKEGFDLRHMMTLLPDSKPATSPIASQT